MIHPMNVPKADSAPRAASAAERMWTTQGGSQLASPTSENSNRLMSWLRGIEASREAVERAV